jgi:hypothetical protein
MNRLVDWRMMRKANTSELFFDVATVIAPWSTLVRSRSRRIPGTLSAIDLTPRQFSQFSPDPHRRDGNSEAAAPGQGPESQSAVPSCLRKP